MLDTPEHAVQLCRTPSVYTASHPNCAPLVGFQHYKMPLNFRCLEVVEKALEDSIHSFWRWDSADSRKRVHSLIELRIHELSAQLNVVLGAPIPEAGWNVPLTLVKQRMLETVPEGELTTSYERYLERSSPIVNLFEKRARGNDRIRVVSVADALCDANTRRCFITLKGVNLYPDDDYLSVKGARLIAPLTAEVVRFDRDPARESSLLSNIESK
ncbi:MULTISPECIES: SGNH hydrolase domain-containing protein [Falsihalocynthiibacter]|uniref:SGNH hydrolase domain-containing protein n=1 Tax=Falsihalocynthiibacter TaxID=2854182 RepID=UPI0030026043